MFAQGDILLIPVDTQAGKVFIETDKVVVGFGEATGHAHVVEGVAVQWLVDACEDLNSLHQFALGNRSDNPELFVSIPNGGQLLHQKNGETICYDHESIDLPAGVYRVVRQRMATSDTIRPVYD